VGILVTGAGGWTAHPILDALLREGHEVVALDLPGYAYHGDGSLHPPVRWIGASVTDLAGVEEAARSVEAIIHLAVAVGPNDYYSCPKMPFSTNLLGSYNVFEAARRQEVSKVVLMGSAPVHLAPLERGRVDARTRLPTSAGGDHLYDLTKRLQEETARGFCETYEMEVVVLRAGHVVDGIKGVDAKGTPLGELQYCRGGWVCRHDLAEACLKALSFDAKGYHAFHIIGSREAREHFDIERTEEKLGFRPRVTFED
jgi:nucleoside-diphosphate-sugar epimerase